MRSVLIGLIVKTYDYINRVVLTLPLSVYEGTWTTLSLSLLCITMILRVRRNVFEITTFSNSKMGSGCVLTSMLGLWTRTLTRRDDLASTRTSSLKVGAAVQDDSSLVVLFNTRS